MKLTVPTIKCLWESISVQDTLYLLMRAISTGFLFGALMGGLPMETVRDGGTFLFEAKSMSEDQSVISYGELLMTYRRYSILPALSLDGILHLEVLDHSFSGEEFRNFVEGVLDQMQPWPLPNSVLVLDNASIHKIPGIREIVETRCVVSY
jgi:hypothetical protein